MKKNNLFKVLGITIVGYILLSWLVPIVVSIFGWEVEASYQIGITKIGSVLVETFTGFGSILGFILLVGGLYGVMDATGVYRQAIEKIAEKVKGKEKIVLFSLMAVIAIISSITGLELGLFIIFPFLISLVLMMGYDKLIALISTFGATIIGMYGATFAGTMYGTLDGMIQTQPTDNILAKVILLVLGLGLLIGFTLLYMKNKNMLGEKTPKQKKEKKVKVAKSEKKKDKVKKIKVKKERVKKTKEEKALEPKKVWPLLLVLGLLFLLFLLGTTTWQTIFGSNWFATAHTKIMEFKIGEFAIIEKLFGGIEALGTWSNPGRFSTYSILILFACVILTLVYKVKLNDSFNAFVKGIKEYVVPALLALLAYSMFVFVFYNPTISVITSWIGGLTDSFNVAVAGAHSIISSIFYPDFYYYAYYIVYTFVQNTQDTTANPIISLIFTNLYSLVMLVGPTSVLLLTSLSITEVKYTDWLKFIWKLALSLLVVSFIVFTVLVLI